MITPEGLALGAFSISWIVEVQRHSFYVLVDVAGFITRRGGVFKRFMRSRFVQGMLGFTLAAYMVLVKYTTRWTIEGQDKVQPIIDGGKGAIGLTWHSRFLMLNAAWKKSYQKPHILISLSRDGALVAYTAEFLGLNTIRGSARKAGSQKSKGGSKALRDMITALDNNGAIVITPDGPRGPRQRMGMGPLGLARISGAPIISLTFSVKNRIQFKSWDRFVLPLPFGKGVIIWGTPVFVTSDTDDKALERIRAQIEDEMNMLLTRADQTLGHEPVLPDEKSA